MDANWKHVLYTYVHNRNRTDVNDNLEAVYPLLMDEQVIRKHFMRLGRIRQSYAERQAKPIRQETRLRFRNVTQKKDKIVVDLDYRKTLFYQIRDIPHEEMKIEHETVTLILDNGSWKISKLEDFTPERFGVRIPAHSDHELPAHPVSPLGILPTPYLNQRVFTTFESASRPMKYDRMKAAQYADKWWNSSNPQYIEFEVDCTSYVSQCLFAGGVPMNYTGRRETGWWYHGRQNGRERWSYSWSVAHSLHALLAANRLGLRVKLVDSPSELMIGDVILYDWDGDGKYQHSVIVTSKDAAGMPLVNAHTTNSKHRYWDYADSHAWTPNTVYRFFHIEDQI